MTNTRNPRTHSNISAARLLSQELGEIKRGVIRYSNRAVSVARDIEQAQLRKRAVHRIARIERDLLLTISRLEEKVGGQHG